MTRAFITILLSLFIASTLATPINLKKTSFKVPRITAKNYVPNGPRALAKAHAKFGIVNPNLGPASLHKRDLDFNLGDISLLPGGDVASHIEAASSSGSSGENGETSAQGTNDDSQFLSPVKVGGQELVVNFDSGSSDAWVFNTGLPSTSQKGHTNFDPSKSSTFKLLQGQSFNISYGDGSQASGPVGQDVLDIGAATFNTQAIGIPNVVSKAFVSDTSSNGLIGLAFSKINTVQPTQQKTFFDNIISQLSQPVFTANLKSAGSSAGSYEFGNIDTTSFTGQLKVTPVDSSKGFWEFASTKAVVNNQQINIQNGRAIADTGTSLMLVSDALLSGYWDQVNGATINKQLGGVIFPCNSELPDLQVAIGGNMAVVEGKNMNFAQVGTDSGSGENFCFGGLQSNAGLPFSIYGDVFFRSNFVVFEGVTPSLGFAPHA